MVQNNGQFETDPDWEYLETTISHALGIKYAAGKIEEICDDPAILEQLAIVLASAQLIQNLHRDYRTRIKGLKAIEDDSPKRGKKGTQVNYVSGNV